jgi:formylmethanofuran:tetrahydromethanopterin formyltransferase
MVEVLVESSLAAELLHYPGVRYHVGPELRRGVDGGGEVVHRARRGLYEKDFAVGAHGVSDFDIERGLELPEGIAGGNRSLLTGSVHFAEAAVRAAADRQGEGR